MLAFVVTAAQSRAAVPADCVDLVHKDDTRCVALGLFKEVSDPGCAHTNEHLNEFRTADMEERHPCFTGHSPCHQGLTGSRRAN